MTKTILTPEQIEFIKANRLKISGAAMAKVFGVTKNIVNGYMFHHSLSVSKELQKEFRAKANRDKLRTTATEEQDEFIKQNYLKIGIKTMADKIGRSETLVKRRMEFFQLVQPKELIEKFKIESRIKPGSISFNKGKKQSEYMSAEGIERSKATRFQKGQIPKNAIDFKDGDVAVRYYKSKDGSLRPYKWIRIEKAKWKMLHVYNWEDKHGPVPEGYIVVFKDGDSMRCEESNLELITLAENMKRNSGCLNLPDSYVAATITGRKHMHLYDKVLQDKQLIEVKRQQLLLRRKIREYDTAGDTGKA